jgi:hypothetical protein
VIGLTLTDRPDCEPYTIKAIAIFMPHQKPPLEVEGRFLR